MARSFQRALILCACLAPGGVLAAQDANLPTYGATDGGSSVLLPNADGRSPYTSVVRVSGRTTCSGVFLDTIASGTDPGDAPAYVLTNGHCVGFPGSNEVLFDLPAASRPEVVVFNFFADSQGAMVVVPFRRVAYATMKGQDVAVIELATRYGELRRVGIEPWAVTSTRPADDERVITVGAPLMANPSASFLRLASCRLQGRARTVVEYIWHWFDFTRNACADIRPGSSGSPVISRESGQVVGLINTTTAGAPAGTECALDHPCEPVPGGAAAPADTSYMTPLIGVDRCFGDGRFDVRRFGCPLDPGVQVTASPAFLSSENPHLTTVPLGRPRTRWDVALSGGDALYRYKVIAAAAGECRDLRGYGRETRVSDRPVIDVALPDTEGHYFLCILSRRDGRDGLAQRLGDVTVVSVYVDTTPPRRPAMATIVEGTTDWRVTFGSLAPEVAFHTYKFGRPSDTRCQEAAGYRVPLLPFVTLPKAGRPYVFCAIPYDQAQNPGAVFEQLLP